MARLRGLFFLVLIVVGDCLQGLLRVALISNTQEAALQFSIAFRDFLVPYISNNGGFSVAGDANSPYNFQVETFELDMGSGTASDDVAAAFALISAGQDSAGSSVGDFDLVVVGSTQGNALVMAAAETHGIPNIHCSGGNPAMWTSATPHAFGIHLPFPWYSQGPIKQARLAGVESVAIMSGKTWKFTRVSSLASVLWAKEAGLNIIGPSASWCEKYAELTTTCRIVNGACRCGLQSEYDAMGYDVDADNEPSFYEFEETLIVESDLDPAGAVISEQMVAFALGVIEDIRQQGGDPDMIVSWLLSGKSFLKAARDSNLSFKAYFGSPNMPGSNLWNGYDGYDAEGNQVLGHLDSTFNMGGGQWHQDMLYRDPIFGNSSNMVSLYKEFAGVTSVGYNPAGCVAAGVVVADSLTKYGSELGTDIVARRGIITASIGSYNDETLWGFVRFNRNNQNSGRLSVAWQVLATGSASVVLPAEAASTPFRYPTPTWEAKEGCPAGYKGVAESQGAPTVATSCDPCSAGRAKSFASSSLAVESCEECAAGTGTLPGVEGTSTCGTCPAGYKQNGDSGICQACPTGTERPEDADPRSCTSCTAGRFSKDTGSATCGTCPANTFQPDLGQASCLCNDTSYKNPVDSSSVGSVLACLLCDAILPGSRSRVGASKASECQCPAGRLMMLAASNDQPACVECPEGLSCSEGGTSGPIVRAGYWASGRWNSLEEGGGHWSIEDGVWYCKSSTHCPDGVLGDCADGRQGRACARCEKGYYETTEGRWNKCSGVDWILPLSVIVGLCFLTCFLLVSINIDMTRTSMSMLTIAATVGQVIWSMQTLSAMRSINFDFSSPFSFLLDWTDVLAFDWNIIHFSCLIEQDGHAMAFASTLLLYPFLLALMLLTWGVSSYVGRRRVTIPQFMNFNGAILTALFLGISLKVLYPFQCRHNPNGRLSILTSPDVECFVSADYHILVAMAVVGFLVYTVGVLGIAGWATWNYPVWITSNEGIFWFKCTQFLFGRFRPECYFFGILQLVRNFVIALIPIIGVEVEWLQAPAMAGMLMLSMVLHSNLDAMRSQQAKYSEQLFTVFLVVLLVASGPLMDVDEVADSNALNWSLCVMVVVMWIMGVVALARALCLFLIPHRSIDAFLCHHKGGAGSFARYTKLTLERTHRMKVFLDSDDLKNLDELFDVVRTQVRSLAVILTPHVLRRMWCAGEIVTATGSNTRLVLANCEDFEFPTSEETQEIYDNEWTGQQKQLLTQFGISLQHVQAAYSSLSQLPVTRVDRGATAGMQAHFFSSLAGLCSKGYLTGSTMRSGISMESRSTTPTTNQPTSTSLAKSVVIVGNTMECEPLAVCHIIQLMLRITLHEDVVVLYPEDLVDTESCGESRVSQHHSQISRLIVVLTDGVLTNPMFASRLLSILENDAAKAGKLSYAVARADSAFEYPTHHFHKHLEKHGIPGTLIAKEQGKHLSAAYRCLFKALAVGINPHGPYTELKRVVEDLGHRLTSCTATISVEEIRRALSDDAGWGSLASDEDKLLLADRGPSTAYAISSLDDEEASVSSV